VLDVVADWVGKLLVLADQSAHDASTLSDAPAPARPVPHEGSIAAGMRGDNGLAVDADPVVTLSFVHREWKARSP